VEVRTDDPDERFSVGSALVTIPAERGPLTIAGTRWHSGTLLVRFAGCDDRTAAEDLRDTMLAIDSGDLAPLEDSEEFYDHDLIGLQVTTLAGEPVGSVTDVLHHAQTLLVIEGSGPRSGAEILVPFVAAIVPEVDVAGRRLVIDPPEGLIDPERAV
jgi:16S rRNA processing protein RimM